MFTNRETTPFLAISSDRIETMRVSDTYDYYGQKVGSHNAGDYCFDNSASSAIEDCLKAAKEAGLINNPLTVYILDNEVDDLGDDNENFDIDSLQEFIENWREDNEYFPTCEGFDFWDGNNYKTVIVSYEFEVEPSHKLIVNEELNQAIDNSDFVKEGFGTRIYETEKYRIIDSACQGHFEAYEIYLK